MTCWAVIPRKNRGAGKQRLQGVLSPAEREQLVARMSRNVLTALRSAHGLDGIAIVAPERLSVPPDVRWIPDPGGGLNAALDAASAHIELIGASRILIVAADLPLLSSADVEAMLEAGKDAQLVIAPDRRERGTNALLLSPPKLIAPQFGEGSLKRHLTAATALGIRAHIVKRPGLQLDIDTPADLAEWRLTGGH